jgi:polyhydroxybutyrate depolymerase
MPLMKEQQSGEDPGAVAASLHMPGRVCVSLLVIMVLCSQALASCRAAPQTRGPARASMPAVTSEAASSPPDSGAINRPIPTTGCGKASPVPPGTTANQAITAHPLAARGHVTRSYLVHVPTGYRNNRPQAVVLVFHGHGGDAAGAESSSGFSALAEQRGFIAVYPQGLLDDDGLPFWASIGPLDYGIDDALFVSDVLTNLQADFCVDPRRIYATGFSNGGGMSGFLACRLAMRIAAFAPVSGNYYALPGGCHPGRPVPVLEVHGTADQVVPYAGIPASINPAWPLPSVPQWLQDWAARDGCTQGPSIFLQKYGVTGEQWLHCQGGTAVVHYRIEGGGHSPPLTIGGRSTSAIMWDFFQSHPLPGPSQ